jgi:DNA-binding Lrp family transcriptional regulator
MQPVVEGQLPMKLDKLDIALIRLMVEEPRAGGREYARLLGVARGTVQSRIGRLERAGVVRPNITLVGARPLGFPVEAFVHLQLAQGKLDEVTARLVAIPEVLHAHTTTGEGDMLCRVVAETNEHLEQIVQQLLALPGVVRTRTEVAMSERIPYRVLPLLMMLHRKSQEESGARGRGN